MKKLALIGCGGIGGYHLEHFIELDKQGVIELVGLCDIIPERAEKYAQLAGKGKAFANYIDMYDEVKPDMVFICIPPYCHGEIELETIRRGIHFFVEKPLALDLDLARKIRDAAKANNIITASGFQCRYSNLVEPNKKFCSENDIVFIDCARMGGIPSAPWWKDKELSGGQIVEQTIHQFDIIRYVFGEPEEVCSYSATGFVKDVEGYNTDDCSTTVVKFKSGAIGALTTGCYSTSGNSYGDCRVTFSARSKRAELRILNSLVIYGESAEKYQDNNPEGFVIKGDGALGASSKDGIVYEETGGAGMLCDRTFIEAAISGDGSKIRSPYEDAFKSVSFTLACNESMRTGKPVKVELE